MTIVVLTSCNEEEDDLIQESQIHQWQYFRQSDGLASNAVNTIFEDSNGNLWVGTAKGVSVYSDGNFESYSTADGLLDNNVYAITEDRDGHIWVGTPAGLNIFVDNQWYYFNYFLGAGIYALLTLKDDQGILIGTGGYGIYRYNIAQQDFGPYSIIDNCQACNSINALYQAKDQSVWVTTFAGARRIQNNSTITIDAKDGLPGDIATSIGEDSWGNIWIGTVEGKTITKVSGNIIRQVSFNNGAEQNFIFGIQEANDGNLWVGTVANGLFYYDGALMKRIYQGPPDNTITALVKDSGGNLWIGTSGEGLALYITNPLH